MAKELDKIKNLKKEVQVPLPLAAVIMIPGNEQDGTPPRLRDSESQSPGREEIEMETSFANTEHN